MWVALINSLIMSTTETERTACLQKVGHRKHFSFLLPVFLESLTLGKPAAMPLVEKSMW